ncbi:hypothetical protein GGR54DRAFT_148415 [Hypoxylon sp. NC1633]|nr:hypothetical protein GGR54DRAFT_148415 [Hypoxylon sp. NC1633]
MEQHPVPRHSSSHGTLHSSYSSQGRPSHGPSPILPLHKPLRSVNENSVLLPSPGALESMLKTTTETGDIGIFSIKPVPPSPQRRDNLSEIGQSHPSPCPSTDEQRGQNNGKKPSSSRDTTSEIISMYGSDSQKSATSTLTPTSPGDIGQRSYSMTTCGSRHLSHHKSTATLQSHTSSGQLQRPRSPFPYPTRLKRPGIRPASPALTENGRVDYSRMVEIDRISYRTIHGPFKPSYPSMPRRPPPLGHRMEANQFMASLPSHGLPPGRHGPPALPYVRTHSAASMASWSAPYRERFDTTSSRTSSLTSLVNMYQRMPLTPRPGPSGLSATIPRYYDYTEDFESRQSRTLTPVQPFAPIPTRAPSFQRPLVLQQPDDHLEVAYRRRDSAFFEPESQATEETVTPDALHDSASQDGSYRTRSNHLPSRCYTSSVRSENRTVIFDGRRLDRGSDIDLLPSQASRDSMDTFNPSLDIESKDAPTYRYTDYRATTTPKTKAHTPERQVQVQGGRTPTIRSEQGVILRDDTQDDSLHEETSGSGVADQIQEQMKTSSPGEVVQRRSRSEPVQDLPEGSDQQEALFNGQPKYVTMSRADSHYSIQATFRNDTGRTIDAPSVGADDNSRNEENYVCAMGIKKPNDGCSDSEEIDTVWTLRNQASMVAQRPEFQHHKRNQAVPRISTSSLSREDNEGFPHVSPSCSTTPIVSPKPISPARQLRLKNSIPQLMKALPALPGDPDYLPPSTPSTRSISSCGADFDEVLVPFRFSRPSTTPQSVRKDKGVRNSDSAPDCDQSPGLQRNVPRFRLKMKKSNSSGVTIASDTRLCDIDQSPTSKLGGKGVKPATPARTRNKLKLRSSKSTAAISTPSPATVRRNADASASSFGADIAQQRPRDLFSFPARAGLNLHPVDKKSSQPSRVGHSSEGSTLGAIAPSKAPYQHEGAPSVHAQHQVRRIHATTSVGTRAASDVRQPRGLKKQLSNLRFLLARPSDSPGGNKEGEPDRNAGLNVDVSRKDFAANMERPGQGNNDRTAFHRRVRSRLFKWVKDAKVAVRVYAKKNRGV